MNGMNLSNLKKSYKNKSKRKIQNQNKLRQTQKHQYHNSQITLLLNHHHKKTHKVKPINFYLIFNMKGLIKNLTI